jgi:hypothetical protein
MSGASVPDLAAPADRTFQPRPAPASHFESLP